MGSERRHAWRCVFLAACLSALAVARPIVFVVSESSPVQKLSLEEVRQLYLAERQRTSTGQEVTLTIRPAGSPEKDALLTQVLAIDEGTFKRIWISKVYQGDAVAPPLPLTSNESVRRFVARSPMAIGILSADADRTRLRVVLQVDDGK